MSYSPFFLGNRMIIKSLQPKDWERVELFFKSGCSLERVAEALLMDRQTFRTLLKDRYGEGYEATVKGFKTLGELLLEATQFKRALGGNTHMLVLLGRLRCGQRDTQDNQPPAQMLLEMQQENMKLQHQLNLLEEELKNRGASKKPVSRVHIED